MRRSVSGKLTHWLPLQTHCGKTLSCGQRRIHLAPSIRDWKLISPSFPMKHSSHRMTSPFDSLWFALKKNNKNKYKKASSSMKVCKISKLTDYLLLATLVSGLGVNRIAGHEHHFQTKSSFLFYIAAYNTAGYTTYKYTAAFLSVASVETTDIHATTRIDRICKLQSTHCSFQAFWRWRMWTQFVEKETTLSPLCCTQSIGPLFC